MLGGCAGFGDRFRRDDTGIRCGLTSDEVDVVVGVILKEEGFLVEHRQRDEDMDPDIVCLPGGHVEKGETLEDALMREMREELGIDVEKAEFICRNYYVASNGEKQNACCFHITEYQGSPTSRTAHRVFWEEDIENLSLDVDRKTIGKLREQLAKQEL